MVEKRFVDGFEFAISQFGEIHAGYLGANMWGYR